MKHDHHFLGLFELFDKRLDACLELADILHAVVGLDAQAGDLPVLQRFFHRDGLHQIGLAELQAACKDHPDLLAKAINEEWTAMGRRYWEEVGVASQIDLRLAPALETLAALRDEGRDGTFDLAFLDADKSNYHHYFEQSMALVVAYAGSLEMVE